MALKPRHSKLDYELVARIMHEAYVLFETPETMTCMAVIVTKFAQYFHDDNQAFDVEKFFAACTMKGSKDDDQT